MSELKPCPCGCVPEAYSYFSSVHERIYGIVECFRCERMELGDNSFDVLDADIRGIRTPEWEKNASAEAKKSAIEVWNKRNGDNK